VQESLSSLWQLLLADSFVVLAAIARVGPIGLASALVEKAWAEVGQRSTELPWSADVLVEPLKMLFSSGEVKWQDFRPLTLVDAKRDLLVEWLVVVV